MTNRDHPRVCGEHCYPLLSGGYSWGSSPRVRGTRSYGDTGIGTAGIIPACAGNTWNVELMPYIVAGSSPRVRGTHLLGVIDDNRPGIIPACAGNTTTP